MIVSIWREVFFTNRIDELLKLVEACSSDELLSIENDAEMNSLYCVLSFLGIIEAETMKFSSEYSKQLLKAFMSILRSGDSLFNDDREDYLIGLKLYKDDYSVLKNIENSY
jgi:hypothetical protein